MSMTILKNVSVNEIPVHWRDKISGKKAQRFTIMIQPELETSGLPNSVSPEIRNQILSLLEGKDGEEDSEVWINRIKSARKNAPTREALE